MITVSSISVLVDLCGKIVSLALARKKSNADEFSRLFAEHHSKLSSISSEYLKLVAILRVDILNAKVKNEILLASANSKVTQAEITFERERVISHFCEMRDSVWDTMENDEKLTRAEDELMTVLGEYISAAMDLFYPNPYRSHLTSLHEAISEDFGRHHLSAPHKDGPFEASKRQILELLNRTEENVKKAMSELNIAYAKIEKPGKDGFVGVLLAK